MQIPASKAPWYSEKAMWLVVGLPAAAVIAGFFTLWLALTRPDREIEVSHTPPAHSLSRNSVTPPLH